MTTARRPPVTAPLVVVAVSMAVALAATLPACGYRAVYGGDAPERFHVTLLRAAIPDAVAADEVASGVRETLAREGALATGEGYPRVEIEVLRLDEGSEGIQVSGGVPKARGMSLGLVARGWVRREAGGPEERDTGDLRAFDVVAAGPSSSTPSSSGAIDQSVRSGVVTALDARRSLGRRVGRRIGLRVLGFPVPADEGAGAER